jgi:flavin reductase (DIM6/NTAB) family NADH-FMN oxidoreductase RutF
MKVEVSLSRANRLINPGPVVLVTAKYKGTVNVMTAAWTMPISRDPPLVGIAIHHRNFTHDLIVKSEQFALNVPGRDLAEKVKLCGTLSGRDVDKFKEVSLTPLTARVVEAPLVEECLGHLECTVVEAPSLGDHTLFVGRVVAVWVEEGAFEETWLLEDEDAKPLHHLGGTYYGTLERRIKV